MMVSKVAVIALVAIISVPILLGYAMNLNEVTVIDYEEYGETVNVTPLYQNGTGYTYANADLYSLNTSFTQAGDLEIIPLYSATSSKTSFPLTSRVDYYSEPYLGGNGNLPGAPNNLGIFNYIYFQTDYYQSGPYVKAYLEWENGFRSLTLGPLHFFTWDGKTQTATICYYENTSSPALRYDVRFIEDPTVATITFQATGFITNPGYIERQVKNPTGATNFADFAAGYQFRGLSIANPPAQPLYNSILNTNAIRVNLPSYPNNALLTMDLNSITDPNYSFKFKLNGYGINEDWYSMDKTTDASGVHWVVNRIRATTSEIIEQVADLYYDSSRLSNTYQLYIDNTGMEFRYVGNWPTLFGKANVYQTFRYDRDYSYNLGGFKNIWLLTDTPKLRVDSSEYRALEYPIIENQTYTPSDFKSNPSTTLSNVMLYGSSLVFGSNTYTVTNGNIMLGTHKVPINGMVLDSIPNDQGNYDNRINGTVVSESANPATITFNGQWSASITTAAQEQYEITKTEWQAGSFAWDGIDQNFLMVGLLASVGTFIALGVYARRARASVWPLMLVCGGAALLFFVML